jgi:ActR/RegA family two-component response regulator
MHRKALVSLPDGRALGTFQVDNLSSAGAQLTGACPLTVGTSVTLRLTLGHEQALNVEARVVRTEHRVPGKFCFAVAFVRVPTEVEDMIQEVVLQSLEESRARGGPAVLVIAPLPEDRQALKHELEALGQHAVCAGTPLDALRWLQDPHVQVEIAMVDLRVAQGRGLDLVAFLAEDFPEVRRVLMASEGAEAVPGARGGKTQSVLHRPWVREDVARAIGLHASPDASV